MNHKVKIWAIFLAQRTTEDLLVQPFGEKVVD